MAYHKCPWATAAVVAVNKNADNMQNPSTNNVPVAEVQCVKSTVGASLQCIDITVHV